MKEMKFSRIYFKHLCFYYEPNSFILPLSVIIDRGGVVVCLGFWGFNYSWKKWEDEYID